MQCHIKQVALIIGWLCFYTTVAAQYYLRGEIRDGKDKPLQNVKIVLHSTGYLHSSGLGGAFGIPSAVKSDSISLSLDGYEPLSLRVNTSEYQQITMKMLPYTASLQKHYLLSLTTSLKALSDRKLSVADETYSALVENGFIQTDGNPVTGITPNVNRASYSNIRRFINMNSQVPEDAVRIEEMLNYFNFNYTEPGGDSIFTVRSQLSSCPWNSENQLLFVQMASKKLDLNTIPPSNLVFLIDVSGSMDMPNRLPLLKSAFRKLVENLRPVDTVSIVVYGGVTGVMLPPTSGDKKEKILQAIEDLAAGGFTPGEAGIRQAYRLAHNTFIKDGNNRVILATDGDFNVGVSGEQELESLILKMKQGGIYLTCLGVGMGNYKDSKIEALAKKGNGNFAYLDDEKEGEKVLVKELTQTLYAVADNVSLNIHFNEEAISAYRLIGFDNKRTALEDTTSTLEGGEIGSGHSMIAVFEVTPGNNQGKTQSPAAEQQLATVTINYSLPGKKDISKQVYDCVNNYIPLAQLDHYFSFATSVCMFGGFLHSSPYLKKATWDNVINLTKVSMDMSNPLHTEFFDMVVKAKKIYEPSKKRKRRNRDDR
ncbi:von Willebrand factor type A domain-containing protein [Agriterribacter sp.]|uniref:vWA domain-containing protein n=3 Tax=Agriterribacter sp. TaxID=2821509 RepID=UPI002C9CBEC8|nr:von Willebrand factor type A domain-containing protein [Agriterribacter sp.]HRO47561.1 von Willebrand factor type A domain-containing protein [Agriterribacter sp.]